MRRQHGTTEHRPRRRVYAICAPTQPIRHQPPRPRPSEWGRPGDERRSPSDCRGPGNHSRLKFAVRAGDGARVNPSTPDRLLGRGDRVIAVADANTVVASRSTHRLTNLSEINVDIETEIVIDRPPDIVSAYAADPSNAPNWYVKIESIEWKTPAPLQIGSQVEFVARFLGRTLRYTYEFVELTPGQRVVMRTQEGPFPMETTYTWSAEPDGLTRMTLRNRGKPVGFSKVMALLIKPAMRRANRKDLAALRAMLESRSG